MLELKHIKKYYQTGDYTTKALDDVSVQFREQEFVAILGPSGSGKTTLLNVIGGLDRYDSGDLLLHGRSTKNFKESDWDAYRNNSVGFIFQSYNLIMHLSILENVELGLTLSGVSASERRKKAEAALVKVGLKEHMGNNPTNCPVGKCSGLRLRGRLFWNRQSCWPMNRLARWIPKPVRKNHAVDCRFVAGTFSRYGHPQSAAGA